MSDERFDLAVVGGGPAGYVAAIRASQLGWRVACIEMEKVLGGTCLRVGCIPSKALLESSHHYAAVRHSLEPHGIRVGSVELDLPALLRRKDDVVGTLGRGIDALFKKNGIRRFSGRASFVAPGRLTVRGTDGKETGTVEADRVLIATGSRSAPLKGVTVDGEVVGTSTEALSYASVPDHLIVIGAGYIGLELGSVWRRLGARVTVVEYLDRILPGMDSELAGLARKVFEGQGLEFRLGRRVVSAERRDSVGVVTCDGGETHEGDRVLLAVGRIPNTDGLGLEAIGVELDERGRIRVDGSYRTNVEGVHAVGDVIEGPMLAHKAEEEGIACVEGMIRGYGRVHYDTIPGVVYTHPEIGTVGATEDRLKEEKRAYRAGRFPFRASGRARAIGETEGLVKVLADEATDRILGVHILGPQAGELINEAAAAMTFGASSEDLARSCHAHPTLGEALKEACLAVHGAAIHA